MRKSIQPNKNESESRLLPWIFAFVAIIPLVFAVPPISKIEIIVFGYLFPSQVVLTILGCMALAFVYCLLGKCANRSYVRQLVFVIAALLLVGLYGYVRGIESNCSTRSLVGLVWFAAPLMYAEMLCGILIKSKIQIAGVATRMIYCFALLATAAIAYSVFFYNGEVRLYVPGLGSVIFGYTMVVILAFAVFIRAWSYCGKLLSICVLLCTVAAVLTESRAAVYPAIILCSIYFCINIERGFNVIPVVLIGLALLVVSPIELLGAFSDRLTRLDSNRFETWFASAEIIAESNVFDIGLGYGLGNVFPYYDWYTDLYTGAIQREYTDGAWNQFVFQGHIMLVEPHNTFIWVVLETGIVGLALLLLCFLRIAKVSGSVRTASGRLMGPYAAVLVLSVMFVNAFDAVILINVASVAIWVCLLAAFLLASNDQERQIPSE